MATASAGSVSSREVAGGASATHDERKRGQAAEQIHGAPSECGAASVNIAAAKTSASAIGASARRRSDITRIV